MYAALLCLMLAVGQEFPDTLVVCPAEFRPAIDEWLQYRTEQGHRFEIVVPPEDATKLQAAIRRAAIGGNLKFVVLMGDVPGTEDAKYRRGATVPTNHLAAKVNTRWGSEPTIATDIPFADLDGDGRPDLAIGRIPADTPAELRQALRKVIRYESESDDGEWQRRLDVVAGIGGFGALADTLIEAAGRQVFMQAVPKQYELRHSSAKTASPKANTFRETVRGRLEEGSLAWIYLGHGMPTELDRVATNDGPRPILSADEVGDVRCQQCRSLAVLVACYTGAFDARSECLAEELALASEGPAVAIAATRVTMPYGNTVFGYELLRACFHDRPTSLGEAMRLAQCRTLEATESDPLRPSLDSFAQGLSPAPVDLESERREHVLMYHLFGDPLLRLRLASTEAPSVAPMPMPLVGAAVISE